MASRLSKGRRAALLATAGACILFAGPALAADVAVASGQTQTTTVFLSGTDTLTVDAGGVLAPFVGEGIHWNGPATGGGITINNAGTLGSQDPGAVGLGADSSVTGTLTINNSGLMGSYSPTRAGLGFANLGPGANVVVNNTGLIGADSNIAIRFGAGDDVLSLWASPAVDNDVEGVHGWVDGGAGNNTLNLNGAGGMIHGATDPVSSFWGWDNFQTLNVNSGTWALVGVGAYNNINIAPGATFYDCSAAACLSALGVTIGDDGVRPFSGNTVTIVNNGSVIEDEDSPDIRWDPSYNISEVVTGSGSFTLKNAGRMYLPASYDLSHMTGQVELTGGTLVISDVLGGNVLIDPGGTLSIGTGGTLTNYHGVILDDGAHGNVLGDITDNGTLVFNRVDSFTYAGNLSGSGALIKAGPGLVTLSGHYTYTGSTTILGGSIDVLSALPSTTSLVVDGGNVSVGAQTVAALSGSGGSLTVGSNLTVQQSADSTYAGTIGGAGSLTLAGSGTLTLPGANTYAGDTTVTGGTLNVTGSLPSTTSLVLSGGAVALNGGSQTVASLTGGGGTVQIASALTVDQTATTTFAGTITGGGALTLDGGGVLNLTGASTYSGPTTVDAGLLKVNGSIASDVSVGSGGALGGSGAIAGAVNVGSGGVIAPGNSPGTLTVAGALTFAAGSTYQVQVQPGASPDHDEIIVTGAGHAATIATGAAVQVQPSGTAGDYARYNRYAILTAEGGVSGAFDTAVSITGALPLRPYLIYSADEVDLVLLRTDLTFASLAATRNQAAVGGALDASSFGAALYDAVLQLDADQSRTAYDALSGEFYASAPTAMIEQAGYVRQSVLARLDHVGEGPSMWGKYLGGWARSDATAGTARIRSDLQGLVIGGDRMVGGDWRLGAAGSYAESRLRSASRDSSGTVETAQVSAYAGGSAGPVTVRLEGAYGWHSARVQRTVAFTGYSQGESARYHADSAEAAGEVSHPLRAGGLLVEPFAGLTYQHLSTDGFGEVGGDAALNVAKSSRDLTFVSAGARASEHVAVSEKLTLNPHASLAWRRASGDLEGQADLAFEATGQAFAIRGVGLDRDSLLIDAGVDLVGSNGGAITLSYTGALSNRWQDHAVKIGATWTF